MNNLITKNVDFNGDELRAVQDPATGKISVGISWVCRGVGLTKDQKDRQIKNIQSDMVLKEGCVKFDAGVFDPDNETCAIDLEFLPLWLAKITITPTMKKKQPEVAEKLITYQLKAKDVLAAAFLQKPALVVENIEELSPQLQILIRVEREQKRFDAELNATNERIKDIRNVVALNPVQWREETGRMINKCAQAMGGNEHIRVVRSEAYDLLETRYGVNLNTRLANKRRRMAEEGMCKSKRDKLNQLDVIAEDKKLIEGYVSIVKELAIKYGVGA